MLVSQFEVADGASKGLTQKDEEGLVWPGSTVEEQTQGKEGGLAGGK